MITQTLCLTLCLAMQGGSVPPDSQVAPLKSMDIPLTSGLPNASPFLTDSVVPSLHVVLARSVAAPKAPPANAGISTSPVAASYMRSFTPGVPHLAPILLPNIPTSVAVVASVAKGRNPEDTLVSLDSVAIQLTEILHLLSEQTGTNLLLLTNDYRLTIRLKNRRFIDALRDICALKDLSYLKVDNTYVIGPDEKLKKSYTDAYETAHGVVHDKPKVQEELTSETYRTSYLDANKVVESLKTVFKDERLLMVAAPPQLMPTVASQTKTTTGNETKVLDADTEALKVSRQLLIFGPRSEVEEALAMVRSMDVSPAQVNIAVSITDVSNDTLRDLGVEWEFGTVDTQFIPGKGISFKSITRAPFDVTATLKLLETQGKAKVLATPHLCILDGQRGYVLVGQRLTFPVVVGTNPNGGFIFSTDQERVGIYLQVAAWITNNGKIRMNLYPQVSTITGFISVGSAQYPQVSTREAQATLDIESGKTIVMAGMLDDEDTQSIRSVPILSQIPFFGELFKSRHHSHTRNQVIVTITPTLIPAGG